MGGQSSIIEDTKNTASQDFARTVAIMLVGIECFDLRNAQSAAASLHFGDFGSGILLLTVNHRWFVTSIMHRT